MQVQAIIAAVVASIIGLLGFALYLKDKEATTAHKAAMAQEVRAVKAEQSLEYVIERQKMVQEHADELFRLRQASADNIEGIGNQLDLERAKNFTLALDAPKDAGDGFTRFLAWWMCEKSFAGGDGQGACDIHAAADEDASVNFVQVFTPDVAAQWSELCEDGQQDFCKYVMVGFTWDGWHNFQNYLMRDLLATQSLMQTDAYFRRVLEQKNDTETKTD